MKILRHFFFHLQMFISLIIINSQQFLYHQYHLKSCFTEQKMQVPWNNLSKR